jgi:predicted nucleic-acid-binding Zn-ribbon protein
MYIASIWILSDHCSAQGGIRMQHSPINRPAISKCSRCGRTEYTQHLIFKQNVSYFFARKERQFSGDFCFSCASRTFASVELTTLFLTWWGIIGFWLGPLYIVHNLVEYITGTFRFIRSEKYVRKGLLRLCVAAGITWIGWLGYKSLGSDWDESNIVWLILIVSIGAPILIAWVVAGFQKSAVGPGTAS